MRAPTTSLLLALAACTPEPPPPRDGGLAFLPVPLPDGGAAVLLRSPGQADGGEPGSHGAAGLPLLSAEAILPDGSIQPLSRDGTATAVEAAARFRVEVGARLPEARLSLLDAQDAMVAADGAVEARDTTRFTLAPAAPLRPGSSYTLRLEGAEGRLLAAEDGGSFEPLSLPLRTAGAPPAPARKAKRRRPR